MKKYSDLKVSSADEIISDSKIELTLFENQIFSNLKHKKVDVRNSVFVNCDFANSKFDDVYFEKVQFVKCRFTGAKFPDGVFIQSLTSVKRF